MSPATPLVVKSLAEAALVVLSRQGERLAVDDVTAKWRFAAKTPEATKFEIWLTGPDLPATIPDSVVAATEISKNLQWRETYRLMVSPPLIALDLCWGPGEPLRIMTFSRGDWETQLVDMASKF